MVVDDMGVSRGLAARSLDNIGIKNVLLLESSKKALETLNLNPVNLIISDYNMPDQDGLDFLLSLKKNPNTNRTGFILMSGKPTAIIMDLGKRLGMNNFLKKPFSDLEMKRCIEAVTGPI